EKMSVYRFSGYWKDVGTIDSLWDANMDMLSATNKLDLFDPAWRVYSRNPIAPPHYVGDRAVISHSLVTEGCEVMGEVQNSVLFNDVSVAEGAVVKYSILMPGAVIEKDACVEYAIVAENARVGARARVGAEPLAVSPEEWGITVIGSGASIAEDRCIEPNTMVAD
ncbi:MAG: glucose-1-phosphate adenylyltransferase, partial [Oscillospiraceae bacterium]|nr:glucose-1-phosphate adenylyltransferase [Oscillospiraceae bacterium]